jgi:hypothetical protein
MVWRLLETDDIETWSSREALDREDFFTNDKKVSGHRGSTLGRPSKTENLRFRLLALAGFAEGRRSQRQLAESVNGQLPKAEQRVTAPTVGAWLHREFERYAQPTITITDPHLLELRVVRLLFRVKPAQAAALEKRLMKEPHISRVERWSGEVPVAAEAVVRDSRDLDQLAGRLNPNQVYDVVKSRDRLADALLAVAQQVAQAEHKTNAGR